MTETKADGKARKERDHAESGNGVFVAAKRPDTDDQNGNRHRDTDVGIPDQSFHFLRQKTS